MVWLVVFIIVVLVMVVVAFALQIMTFISGNKKYREFFQKSSLLNSLGFYFCLVYVAE